MLPGENLALYKSFNTLSVPHKSTMYSYNIYISSQSNIIYSNYLCVVYSLVFPYIPLFFSWKNNVQYNVYREKRPPFALLCIIEVSLFMISLYYATLCVI